MVPVSSAASSNVNPSEAEAPTSTSQSATEPNTSPAKAPTQSLGPQERKNQKLQQRLEKSIAEALPAGTSSNRDGFIESLAPSRNGQELTVNLELGWYQLEPGQQEAIASALWGQRDSLKFQQLKIKDAKGKTLARNPVVGDQMVILRR